MLDKEIIFSYNVIVNTITRVGRDIFYIGDEGKNLFRSNLRRIMIRKRIGSGLIPEATLRRLLYYMKCLKRFSVENIEYVHSADLGKKCGVKDSVVRKDLSYFGEFGTRGKGYNTLELLTALENLFEKSDKYNTIIIGAGKLGTAILKHSQDDFKVNLIAAFDKRKDIVGKDIDGIPVYHVDNMEDIVQKEKVKIAIIAIPPDEVQSIVNRLVNAGVKSFLSLALVPISVPDDVDVSFFDILSEVEFLFLKLNFKELL